MSALMKRRIFDEWRREFTKNSRADAFGSDAQAEPGIADRSYLRRNLAELS